MDRLEISRMLADMTVHELKLVCKEMKISSGNGTKQIMIKNLLLPLRFTPTDANIHEAVDLYIQKTEEAKDKYQDISTWDVSGVTNMSHLFSFKGRVLYGYGFNPDLSNWDVSNVTDMTEMFRSASSFNGNISNWDTGKVTNMSGMFMNCGHFNGNISNWDTSKVTNMAEMFKNARKFNQNLSRWDTSNVKNMSAIFYDAENFNGDITTWNTSKVTNMAEMFFGAENFNRDISTKYMNRLGVWGHLPGKHLQRIVATVKTISGFRKNIAWFVGNVTNMSRMFQNATSFNKDVSNWNIENVRNMNFMFLRAISINANSILSWDLRNVVNKVHMFN